MSRNPGGWNCWSHFFKKVSGPMGGVAMATVRLLAAQGKQNRVRKSRSHPFLSQLVDVSFRGVRGVTLENVFWNGLNRGREEITFSSKCWGFWLGRVVMVSSPGRADAQRRQVICAGSPRTLTSEAPRPEPLLRPSQEFPRGLAGTGGQSLPLAFPWARQFMGGCS